eukprot:m.308831 g.308831  ORF g.308831 m.308831 type:complete len:296 (+) comp44938_c0_seq1:290-1177(+)
MLRHFGNLRLLARSLPVPKTPFPEGKTLEKARFFCSNGGDSDQYRDAKPRIAQYIQSRLNDPNRFQRISQRKDTSLVPFGVTKDTFNFKYTNQHKGCFMLKGHEDMAIYHQLFSYVRPRTVIELGTFNGGSALWMADLLNMLDVSSKVYSFDIDPTLLNSRAKEIAPPNLTFLTGTSAALQKTFPVSFLKACDRPLVLIEDSHNNFFDILRYFHPFLQSGDYLVVEDSNPFMPKTIGPGTLYPDVPYEFKGSTWVYEKLRAFLNEHDEEYAVDSFFTDFLGYNVTHNWNGYIRKM